MTSLPTFSLKQLSAEEIGAFLEQGFLLLRGASSKEWAAQIAPLVWQEMPEFPEDSTAWTQPVRIVEKVLDNFPVGEILTERYTNAIDDLCGIGKWETNMGVGYWVNVFPRRASWPMRPQAEDWHIDVRADGNNDESAHLGLNIMEFFTEVNHSGGGTAVRVGSHRYVARLSAETGHRSTPHLRF